MFFPFFLFYIFNSGQLGGGTRLWIPGGGDDDDGGGVAGLVANAKWYDCGG